MTLTPDYLVAEKLLKQALPFAGRAIRELILNVYQRTQGQLSVANYSYLDYVSRCTGNLYRFEVHAVLPIVSFHSIAFANPEVVSTIDSFFKNFQKLEDITIDFTNELEEKLFPDGPHIGALDALCSSVSPGLMICVRVASSFYDTPLPVGRTNGMLPRCSSTPFMPTRKVCSCIRYLKDFKQKERTGFYCTELLADALANGRLYFDTDKGNFLKLCVPRTFQFKACIDHLKDDVHVMVMIPAILLGKSFRTVSSRIIRLQQLYLDAATKASADSKNQLYDTLLCEQLSLTAAHRISFSQTNFNIVPYGVLPLRWVIALWIIFVLIVMVLCADIPQYQEEQGYHQHFRPYRTFSECGPPQGRESHIPSNRPLCTHPHITEKGFGMDVTVKSIQKFYEPLTYDKWWLVTGLRNGAEVLCGHKAVASRDELQQASGFVFCLSCPQLETSMGFVTCYNASRGSASSQCQHNCQHSRHNKAVLRRHRAHYRAN